MQKISIDCFLFPSSLTARAVPVPSYSNFLCICVRLCVRGIGKFAKEKVLIKLFASYPFQVSEREGCFVALMVVVTVEIFAHNVM